MTFSGLIMCKLFLEVYKSVMRDVVLLTDRKTAISLLTYSCWLSMVVNKQPPVTDMFNVNGLPIFWKSVNTTLITHYWMAAAAAATPSGRTYTGIKGGKGIARSLGVARISHPTARGLCRRQTTSKIIEEKNKSWSGFEPEKKCICYVAYFLCPCQTISLVFVCHW